MTRLIENGLPSPWPCRGGKCPPIKKKGRTESIRARMETILESLEEGTPFLKQDRPAKVKEIYRALKRDHPEMSPEMKARIAIRRGRKTPHARKSPKHGGPAYKAPISPE